MKLEDFTRPMEELFAGRLAKKAEYIPNSELQKIAVKAAGVAFAVGIFAGLLTGSAIVFMVVTPLTYVAAGSYFLHHTNIIEANARAGLDAVKQTADKFLDKLFT